MIRWPLTCFTNRAWSRNVSTGSRAARQTRNSSSKSTTTAASKSHERKTESCRSVAKHGKPVPQPEQGRPRPPYVETETEKRRWDLCYLIAQATSELREPDGIADATFVWFTIVVSLLVYALASVHPSNVTTCGWYGEGVNPRATVCRACGRDL